MIYNPFGKKEIQKLRRIVKEAKNQIPKSSRGCMIIRSVHSKPLVDIANEKLVQLDYQREMMFLSYTVHNWDNVLCNSISFNHRQYY